jgi:hypothetical protein
MLRSRLVPTLAVLAAVGLAVHACRDDVTRPPIPTPNAAYAGPGGQRYCAEWSCAYDTCRDRPDWDGGSCCVEYTVVQGEAVGRPGWCAVPQTPGNGGSCDGQYRLDAGDSFSNTVDDQWYCSVAFSCCSGGDKTKVWNGPYPYPNPTDNPNCQPGSPWCTTPNLPPGGGTSSAYPQPGSGGEIP